MNQLSKLILRWIIQVLGPAEYIEGQTFSLEIINRTNMNYDYFFKGIAASVIYSFIGIIILLLAYLVIEKLTPEKSWQEIVKNQNVALAIVFASFILGISIIIAASIHG